MIVLLIQRQQIMLSEWFYESKVTQILYQMFTNDNQGTIEDPNYKGYQYTTAKENDYKGDTRYPSNSDLLRKKYSSIDLQGEPKSQLLF